MRTLSAFVVLLGLALGLTGESLAATSPAPADGPSVSAPSDEDLERLAAMQLVIRGLLKGEESQAKFGTAAGKLGTIRAVLEAGLYGPADTYELHCLGVVLGEAFVQEMEMNWVVVEDEYGRDLGLQYPGSEVLLFPVTMISKRVEEGVEIDIFDLFNGVAAHVERIAEERADAP